MTVVEEKTGRVLAGLMEVILHVKDMNAMVTFYRDKLGLKVTYPTDLADYGKESWVTLDTGRCTLALHGGGRTRHGEAPSHRIVFQTDDIQGARNHLISRGVQLGEVRSAAPRVLVTDGHDPEGNGYSIESHVRRS